MLRHVDEHFQRLIGRQWQSAPGGGAHHVHRHCILFYQFKNWSHSFFLKSRVKRGISIAAKSYKVLPLLSAITIENRSRVGPKVSRSYSDPSLRSGFQKTNSRPASPQEMPG